MGKWAIQEIKFLKNNYKERNYIEISEILNHSLQSVYWKAYDLGIKKGRWNEANRLNKDKIYP